MDDEYREKIQILRSANATSGRAVLRSIQVVEVNEPWFSPKGHHTVRIPLPPTSVLTKTPHLEEKNMKCMQLNQ